MTKIYIVTNGYSSCENAEEEYGDWSSEEGFTIDRVTLKKPYNEAFESYEFPSLEVDTKFYLLKMKYYYGDSFGSGTKQEIILCSPYRDYLEYIKKTIENNSDEYTFIIPAYPKYGYDEFQISNPAFDYFSGIDSLTIEEYTIVND